MMEHYHSYMNRQESSLELHEKLLNLEVEKKPSSRPWAKYGALAACAALILGVGVWKLGPVPTPEPEPVQSSGQFAPDYTPLPGQKDTVGPEDLFVVSSPVEDDVYGFFYMPAIAYPDVTQAGDVAARIALPEGAFMADLEKEDIQKLFWPEGKPESTDYDLPWTLFWDGYTIHGCAWYNGQGELFQVHIFGEKGRSAFHLSMCPGHLPLTCMAETDRVTSSAFGVEVTGWSKSYDRDGDGLTDYICGSEFMTESGVGVQFESWNNGKAEDSIDGEAWFNTLFIRQALPDGLYLDHLMTNDNIPAWREDSFESLAQAREETDFAPYLPTKAPVAGYDEFEGRISYQEGSSNTLWVRWSQMRGYNYVQVSIYRDGYHNYNLVDPSKPETYDERLYPIPWCDSVPEEYRETVERPAFKAEDMSLEIVESRCYEKDTGGLTFSFEVLHPDGTVVSYRCDGMTAQQVWVLVEETL